MNKIITTHVMLRNILIPVEQLKDKSQVLVEVECKHGRRWKRWSRRYQLCKQCSIEVGVFNTSPKGRKITWGDKISKAKKGVKFSDKHKNALRRAHLGIPLSKAHKDAQNINRPRGSDHPAWKNISLDQTRIKKDVLNSLSGIARKMRNKEHITRLVKADTNLDYTAGDFIDHMEKLFTLDMSWDNYGLSGWTIDHVLPDSWLTYNSYSDEDFKKSFSLNNLQPSFDNFIKGNRYEG